VTRPIVILCSIVVLLVAGCEDPRNDMGDQPKYVTYQPSDFFPDGASARMPTAGSVARDKSEDPQQMAAADATFPFSITTEVVHQGAASFDIYCSVCHGRLGNGEGMIVQRGLTRPPSFHVPRLIQASDAHFYNVITKGYGAMFSYDDRVMPRQRWEIIAYIRALQAAGQQATPQTRQALIAGGDRKTPTTGGGG
jgi:mono/diheme cytochrome c family protein